MLSILTEFAYGNINPNERSFKRATEYDKAIKAVTVSERNFLSALSEEEKALYDQFAVDQRELTSLSDADQFVRGFKLGALMMIEVITGKDDVVTQ